jgi:glycosyltransferase involved in cell wall biosynthesis
VVIETHPVQYHAPVYQALARGHGIPVIAVYGSDFSVAGYRDREFGSRFAWDTDLLSGYTPYFLSRVAEGGAAGWDQVSARGLSGLLKHLSAAAVLLVGYSPRFYQHSAWEAWKKGLPLLFRGETTDHARGRGAVKHWLRDRFLVWLYRHCSALLYVGQRSLQHYQRLGSPADKLYFSPYCVDLTAFRPAEVDRGQFRLAARAELGLAEGSLAVLFSGKLVPRKAPDLLVQAVRSLPAETRERVVVLCLGDGELREPLRDLAGAEPSVAIRFLGFQNQHAMSRFYHAADLLALPSREGETWGLVVNEALHHGLPCVVSDRVGCAPDLVEPGVTGEVFPAESEQALGEALQRGLRLAGGPDVRETCRRRASNYTVEAAAAGIARAYQAVIPTGVGAGAGHDR